ncbi:restriction endonuclease subunit S [Saccharospirillum impatiens]|uniref:restriction endonuclease subunit S n=1 Tax=Saccharospirillum impatiens TaxID=169438 RepID=UPI0004062B8C|nr:restriction endonuclease subunit S [Saccharospirillum impatiens]
MESEWQTTTLGEISMHGGHGFVDGPFGSNLPASSYTITGVPVIRGSNLSRGIERFNSREFVYVSEETARRLSRSLCKAGDIIFTKKGTLGQTGFIPLKDESEYLLSSNQMKLTVDTNSAIPLFVYYLVSSTASVNKILKDSESTGVPKINLAYLKNFPIKIPDLVVQKKIAQILGSLDEKIELNRKINSTLESIAQALFKSWFVDFDPVIDNALAAGSPIPDELKTKADARAAMGDQRKPLPESIRQHFPNRFEFTDEMGWVPEGWAIRSMEEITEFIKRGISPTYTDEGGVRVLNQKCVRNHVINFELARRNDPCKKKVDGRELNTGDVVINSTGVGTLGRVAQVTSLTETTVVDSHVTVLRPNPNIYRPFTFGRLIFSIESTIEAMGEGSTGQTELSRKVLQDLKVLTPQDNCRNLIESELNQIACKIDKNLEQINALSKVRDTLLPKLLSGELHIPDAQAAVEDALAEA